MGFASYLGMTPPRLIISSTRGLGPAMRSPSSGLCPGLLLSLQPAANTIPASSFSPRLSCHEEAQWLSYSADEFASHLPGPTSNLRVHLVKVLKSPMFRKHPNFHFSEGKNFPLSMLLGPERNPFFLSPSTITNANSQPRMKEVNRRLAQVSIIPRVTEGSSRYSRELGRSSSRQNTPGCGSPGQNPQVLRFFRAPRGGARGAGAETHPPARPRAHPTGAALVRVLRLLPRPWGRSAGRASPGLWAKRAGSRERGRPAPPCPEASAPPLAASAPRPVGSRDVAAAAAEGRLPARETGSGGQDAAAPRGPRAPTRPCAPPASRAYPPPSPAVRVPAGRVEWGGARPRNPRPGSRASLPATAEAFLLTETCGRNKFRWASIQKTGLLYEIKKKKKKSQTWKKAKTQTKTTTTTTTNPHAHEKKKKTTLEKCKK
ncbi:uncharacterized protein LOC126933813 [Macaca thibetana thibetana]|uniref:uncharacterized protein LOC126933813 n=1 Tax=Macaca thibetana thibetana TaxID=257877 RepID=UPI0021BC89CE|nr:uncharacterized protein LOC126933813 [Macaca thibetana thibetana]